MAYADLHIHTNYSFDGTASVRAVLAAAKKAGLQIISVTDHDTINGAIEAERIAAEYELTLIPGVEISTAEGHLLAYNLRSPIPRKLSLIGTLRRVGDLGGFAVAAHPMNTGWSMNSLSRLSILKALNDSQAGSVLKGIETFNATLVDQSSNRLAALLAEEIGIARLGNSDSHTLNTLGAGRTHFTGSTIEDLMTAIHNRSTTPVVVERMKAIQVLGSWLSAYLGRSIKINHAGA